MSQERTIEQALRWHKAIRGVAAALSEAGYPTVERHEHPELTPATQFGWRMMGGAEGDMYCAIEWGDNCPPHDVFLKALTLCGVEEFFSAFISDEPGDAVWADD